LRVIFLKKPEDSCTHREKELSYYKSRIKNSRQNNILVSVEYFPTKVAVGAMISQEVAVLDGAVKSSRCRGNA
jgi:hypothetical protein